MPTMWKPFGILIIFCGGLLGFLLFFLLEKQVIAEQTVEVLEKYATELHNQFDQQTYFPPQTRLSIHLESSLYKGVDHILASKLEELFSIDRRFTRVIISHLELETDELDKFIELKKAQIAKKFQNLNFSKIPDDPGRLSSELDLFLQITHLEDIQQGLNSPFLLSKASLINIEGELIRGKSRQLPIILTIDPRKKWIALGVLGVAFLLLIPLFIESSRYHNYVERSEPIQWVAWGIFGLVLGALIVIGIWLFQSPLSVTTVVAFCVGGMAGTLGYFSYISKEPSIIRQSPSSSYPSSSTESHEV